MSDPEVHSAVPKHDPGGIWSMIAALIEIDRIAREGPTLKNVSDAMRSIAVIVVMMATAILMWRHSLSPSINPSAALTGSIVSFLWMAWAGMYAILVAIQAGLLFTMTTVAVLTAILGTGKAHAIADRMEKSKRLKGAVGVVVALLITYFMIATILFLSVALKTYIVPK